MGKRQGEVITVTLIAVCMVSALVGAFMMQVPMVKGLLGFKDQKVVQTQKTEPVWLVGPKGEKYLATKESVMDTTQGVSQPIIETLKGWVIALGVLCFIFPGVGVWLLARYKNLKVETKKIIQSVQAARAIVKEQPDPSLIKKLDAAMDGVQDQSTKNLVSALKR